MLLRVARYFHESYSGLSKPLWLLALVLLVNRCGSMALPFLALYLTKQLGYSETSTGTLLSVYGVGAIGGTYFGGRLVGRYGPIRVIIGSFLLSIPAYVLVPFCHSPMTIAGALLAWSLLAEAVRPAAMTATTLLSPTSLHPKAMALNRLAVNLGMSIGPVVGGWLAGIDYRFLFWVNAAAAFVSGCLTWRFFAGNFGNESCVSDTSGGDTESSTIQTGKPWHDRIYVQFLALNLITGIVFFQLLSTFPMYLRERYGLQEFQIGSLMTLNTLVIVAFEMLLTHFMRRFRPANVLAVGVGLIGLGFALMPWGHSVIWACCSVLVWTLGEMLWGPYSATFAASRSHNRNRGEYMGLYTMSFSVSHVVAPILGTSLYAVSPSLPWHMIGIVTLCLVPGYIMLGRLCRTE